MSRRFTEEEKIEIIKLYQEGLSTVEIGKLFNRARCTIRQILIKYGVKLRTERKRSPLNLSGMKFGELTVLDRGEDLIKGRNRITWNCLCSCGKITNVTRSNLTSGNCRSCGCKKTLPFGEAAFNRIYGHYKANAKQKNREFTLTKEDFRTLTKMNCFYCGIEPQQQGGASSKKRKNQNNGLYTYNGIDRIDSSKGYTLDNVVTSCYNCNYSKMSRTQEDFINWIKRTYLNLKNKGIL